MHKYAINMKLHHQQYKKATPKEKALEEENRKLKELIGKKELELDMLQELLKKKNYLR